LLVSSILTHYNCPSVSKKGFQDPWRYQNPWMLKHLIENDVIVTHFHIALIISRWLITPDTMQMVCRVIVLFFVRKQWQDKNKVCTCSA
jgi:hypothetical protein